MREALLFLLLFCLPVVGVQAVGWEATRLVARGDTGQLVYLEYASEGADEQNGIRRYIARDEKRNRILARCSYNDEQKLRRLVCSLFDGRPAHRIYRSQRLRKNNKTEAHSIYRKHVGSGLESSAGSLDDEIYVCIAGCPKSGTGLIISVTCGECGMEEEACYFRYEKRPKRAVLTNADSIDIRDSPSLRGRVIGTLQQHQAVEVVSAQARCVEIATREGLSVGRWLNVRTAEAYPTMTGWVFDKYLEYAPQ